MTQPTPIRDADHEALAAWLAPLSGAGWNPHEAAAGVLRLLSERGRLLDAPPTINRVAFGGHRPWTDTEQVRLATHAMDAAGKPASTHDVYEAINELIVERDAALADAATPDPDKGRHLLGLIHARADERDAALARAEKAERERDEARDTDGYVCAMRYVAMIDAARAEAARLREALNKIACWSEGDEVGSSYDEPASAQTARDALAAADTAEKPEGR